MQRRNAWTGRKGVIGGLFAGGWVDPVNDAAAAVEVVEEAEVTVEEAAEGGFVSGKGEVTGLPSSAMEGLRLVDCSTKSAAYKICINFSHLSSFRRCSQCWWVCGSGDVDE
jgi:hypothetical protein